MKYCKYLDAYYCKWRIIIIIINNNNRFLNKTSISKIFNAIFIYKNFHFLIFSDIIFGFLAELYFGGYEGEA